MDYRYLKAFLLTAEHSSFSKAAEHLKVAQSAVSRQIKLLEETLGEELIIRSSKKVILTTKGQELYLAGQNFDQVANTIFEREDNKPVRIGILSGLLKNWFTPLMVKFYKKNKRNMSVKVYDHKELKVGIETGKFDIIFSTENIQSDLISSLKLFDEKLVLISKDEVNKKKLNDLRWIIFGELDNLLKISKKQSNDIIEIGNLSSIVNLVRQGVGIAVVPDHVLKKNESLQIYEMSSLPKSEIFMTTLNYKHMPANIKEVADIVKQPR